MQDFSEIVNLVYLLNSKPENHIIYACKTLQSIESDFEFMLTRGGNKVVGVWHDNELIAVAGAICIDEIERVDIVGPFVSGKFKDLFEKLSIDMIDLIKSYYKGFSLSFNINVKNKNVISLMLTIGSVKEEDERLYMLKRENYKMLPFTDIVQEYNNKYEEVLRILHDEIAHNYYLTSNQLIASVNNDRRVFILTENNELLGYGVLTFTNKTDKEVLIELVGVKSTHRRLGYGRMLFNRLLKEAFVIPTTEKVELVVDDENSKAIKLYESLGFHCRQRGISYTLFG